MMTLKWNGWGTEEQYQEACKKYPGLLKSLEGLFETKFERSSESVRLDEIKLEKARLPENFHTALLKILNKNNIKTDIFQRVLHCRGRSLTDLLYLRSGKIESFPDAVIYPETEDQIFQIIQLCQKFKVNIIPFGGGSSVTGAVNCMKISGYKSSLVMNMSRFKSLVDLDEVSQTAEFESGIFGPDLEKILAEKGYTLGHFPQSFDFSTLGGWVVTKGAGFMSDYYGKAEEMVLSMRMCSPAGIYESEMSPVVSEGPSLAGLIAGSEGTLGVITKVKLKIKKMEANVSSYSCLFKNFDDACDVFRQIRQKNIKPMMLRLSDPEETFYYRELNKKGNLKEKLQAILLKTLGFNNPVLMLIMVDGDPDRNIRKQISKIMRNKKYISLGKGPVNKWYESRFSLPYLRDFLLDYGIASDTFETFVGWSDLNGLRKALYKKVEDIQKTSGKKIMIMSHLSHSYEYGVCIYFTVFYIMTGKDKIAEWKNLRNMLYDTVVKNKGSLSHHHGLGTDHNSFLKQNPRKEKFRLLAENKKFLDPKNIMNPGKIFL